MAKRVSSVQNIYLRSASFKMVSRYSPEDSPFRIMPKLIAHTTTQSLRYTHVGIRPKKLPFYFNSFTENGKIIKSGIPIAATIQSPAPKRQCITLSGHRGVNSNFDAMDFKYLFINNSLNLLHLQHVNHHHAVCSTADRGDRSTAWFSYLWVLIKRHRSMKIERSSWRTLLCLF